MTDWLLQREWAIQGLAALTVIGVAWLLARFRKPHDPKAKDLPPMSAPWMSSKHLHRKDEHHH